MKRFINKFLLFILPFLCVLPAQTAIKTDGQTAPAAAQSVKERPSRQTPRQDYAACFAAWDKKMHTLRTDFMQTTEYDGVLISRSEGRIYYLQDGPKLRLDNLEGGKTTQSALTDKKTILVLDEKGRKVTQVGWADWLAGQPNQALFDFGNYAALIARHNLSVLEHKEGNVILRLTPKNQKESYALYVAVGEKDCFPVYIAIQSDLMKTTAELTDRRLNAELEKDVFKGMTK